MAKKTKKEPKKVGRPSGYSKAIGDAICLAIQTPYVREDGTAGYRNLRAILQEMGTPSMSMVMRWLVENEQFREQYRASKEVQTEGMVDEALEIVDELPVETITFRGKDGAETVTERTDSGGIARNRLRFDARKWIASRLLPKKYGDKIELGGTVGLDWGALISEARKRVEGKE